MGFKVGDDVITGDGAGRIINEFGKNFHVQLQEGVYVYTAEMMKPLEQEEPEPPLAPWEKELLWTPFEQSVRRHTDRIANILLAKNKAYGDSALNPVRVFSKADREEQLYVRIDDKISRIQRGTDFANEDTIDDLIGYLILLKIAKESA